MQRTKLTNAMLPFTSVYSEAAEKHNQLMQLIIGHLFAAKEERYTHCMHAPLPERFV